VGEREQLLKLPLDYRCKVCQPKVVGSWVRVVVISFPHGFLPSMAPGGRPSITIGIQPQIAMYTVILGSVCAFGESQNKFR
jgi:hypothetical protein